MCSVCVWGGMEGFPQHWADETNSSLLDTHSHSLGDKDSALYKVTQGCTNVPFLVGWAGWCNLIQFSPLLTSLGFTVHIWTSSFKIPLDLSSWEKPRRRKLVWLQLLASAPLSRVSPDTHHPPPLLFIPRFSSPTVSTSDWLVTYIYEYLPTPNYYCYH